MYRVDVCRNIFLLILSEAMSFLLSLYGQIFSKMDKQLVNNTIHEMGLDDFSTVTIRDIARLSKVLEQKTGEPFVH